jgi:hypothetical protein
VNTWRRNLESLLAKTCYLAGQALQPTAVNGNGCAWGGRQGAKDIQHLYIDFLPMYLADIPREGLSFSRCVHYLNLPNLDTYCAGYKDLQCGKSLNKYRTHGLKNYMYCFVILCFPLSLTSRFFFSSRASTLIQTLALAANSTHRFVSLI